MPTRKPGQHSVWVFLLGGRIPAARAFSCFLAGHTLEGSWKLNWYSHSATLIQNAGIPSTVLTIKSPSLGGASEAKILSGFQSLQGKTLSRDVKGWYCESLLVL